VTTAPSHRESDEAYRGVVALLNDRWGVIVCKDGIQWILQRQDAGKSLHGAPWRGRSYCRTRQALIRDARYHAGDISPAALSILEALPATIDILPTKMARPVLEHRRALVPANSEKETL